MCLLRARQGNFSAHFAVKCSSMCTMNVGTSKRSPCSSLGFSDYNSVRTSNKLTERSFGHTIIDTIRMHFLIVFVARFCYFCS